MKSFVGYSGCALFLDMVYVVLCCFPFYALRNKMRRRDKKLKMKIRHTERVAQRLWSAKTKIVMHSAAERFIYILST
jgi:hypothetical protein